MSRITRQLTALSSFLRSDVSAPELLKTVFADTDPEVIALAQQIDTFKNSVRMKTLFRNRQGFESESGTLPSISEDDYATLHGLVTIGKPSVVVETGVAAGLSSTAILDALEQNGQGRLCSIDLPPDSASGRSMEDGLRYDRV